MRLGTGFALLLAGFLFCGGVRLSAQFPDTIEYTEVLGKDCVLFDTAETETFLKQARANLNYPLFRWTSNQKTDARYPGYRNSPKLTMFGLDVCEMIVRFSEGKAESLYVMFYNRGDMKEMDRDDFTALCEKLQKKLADFTGVEGEEKKGKLTSHDRLYCFFYVTKKYVFELKWSIRKEARGHSCEYIQLEISRFDPENDPRKKSLSRTASAESVKSGLAGNLKKEENGGFWIDNIPMVDQGEKGYGVPAVLERILRYYGNEDVSQHVLAQLSESEAEQGTSVESAIPAIKKVSTKIGVRLSPVYRRMEDVKDIQKMLKKYNSFAKRAGAEKVEPVIVQNGNMRIYMTDETLDQCKPEIYKSMWMAQKGDYAKFKKFLKENLQKGIPVIWSLRLGMFPEEGRMMQTRGNHMRLIIGLNEAENKIYFSDTWGAGHEKKAMDMDEAWTVTNGYFSLLPRK